MGHQALHFSKAIQRSVGWPFCVERREGRGIDEKAPSISPMKGECSATTWDSWVAFLCGETRGREGLMRKTLRLPHEGEYSATTWDSWVYSVWCESFLLD